MLQNVQVMMASYLDQPSFASGKAPLLTQYVDISPILETTPGAAPEGATFQQIFAGAVEQYLIAETKPNPASTADAPLPNINGIFFGGTQVE